MLVALPSRADANQPPRPDVFLDEELREQRNSGERFQHLGDGGKIAEAQTDLRPEAKGFFASLEIPDGVAGLRLERDGVECIQLLRVRGVCRLGIIWMCNQNER